MKKTKYMATIGQPNYSTGNYSHIERRVYKDEDGKKFVKINGDYYSVTWLTSHGRKVDCYYHAE